MLFHSGSYQTIAFRLLSFIVDFAFVGWMDSLFIARSLDLTRRIHIGHSILHRIPPHY